MKKGLVKKDLSNSFVNETAEWAKGSNQEVIVLLTAVIVFFLLSIFVKGFLSVENILLLVRNVSVLGTFAVGMAIVVLGRGIDLSQVATMAITSAFLVDMIKQDVSIPIAIIIALGLAIIFGLVNGLVIAFLEIPAIFATLCTSYLILGAGRFFLLNGENHHYLNAGQEAYLFLGQGRLFGIPIPIFIFAALAFLVHLFLKRTRYGYFIPALGDNDQTASLTGISVRPLIVLQYVLCAVMAYLAGVVFASSLGGVDVALTEGSLIVDVILVVVLGGVSLAGGRGNIGSVIIGVILIGILLNGLTILDVQSFYQNIIKGVVLLGALFVDNKLNPRSEEIVRYGEDI